MPTVAIHTLGCKLNFSESSTIVRRLSEHGFTVVDFSDKADFFIINTCTVTGSAEKKCRTLIHAVHRRVPQARIAVVGCFAQLRPDELKALDGVEFVFGSANKMQVIPTLLEAAKQSEESAKENAFPTNDQTFFSSYSSDDRTRSFLKIQDGCNYFCTYCAIPFARGRNRSDSIANVIRNANEIVAKGIKEIILTGVNIGEFGTGTSENLYQLLIALEQVKGLQRLRISSIEPNLLTDDIIRLTAKSKVILPHFHIPLQSGCNKVLESMHRKYTRELFAHRVLLIKELIPDCCIAGDVIAGFAGETDADFEETYSFLEQLPISMLHVFPYSRRPGTKAALMPEQVDEKIKRHRVERLLALSDQKKNLFYNQHKGNLVQVLFESEEKDGFMFGFSENYIKAKTPYNPELINQIKTVRLENVDKNGIFSTLLRDL